MAKYYPIYLNLKGALCIVVGGGEVAVRKVKGLLESGGYVRVISLESRPELTSLAAKGRIELKRRAYRNGDLAGARLAIAATADAEVNASVSAEARAAGIPVNVVDDAAHSSFILPATLERGDITIAVSTAGRSPALARKLKAHLEKELGQEYAELAAVVSSVRDELKQKKIKVNPESWQEALNLEALLGLLRAGKAEEARAAILNSLSVADGSGVK